VISRNIVKQRGQKIDRPTKNRRRRTIAVDDRCLRLFKDQLDAAQERAAVAGVDLIDDPYVLTVSLTGDDPWDPDTITQFFARIRKRLGLDDELKFHGFRRFMDTYGQELGFSLAQVSIRAGHDPAVASKHYTGKVAPSDRAIADAIGDLIRGTAERAPAEPTGWPEPALDSH
jgi:integrase